MMCWAGALINERDNDGATALHVGIDEEPLTGHIRGLLDSGADVDVADNKGKTPLHKAVARISDAIFQLLLDYGVRVDVRDLDGNAPLNIVALLQSVPMHTDEFNGRRTRMANCARSLLEAGASLYTHEP